jgi:Immunity protein 50
MEPVESLIIGSERLTSIFGYWPSFHDAEVIELHFWRGDVEPDAKRYIFPVLTVKLHVWELTSEVDPKGYFILRNHTLTTLRFHDVREFSMDGFNQQNAILGLSITHQERSGGPSPFFEVHFDSAFGMDAKFECFRVEVLDAMKCTPDGKGPS